MIQVRDLYKTINDQVILDNINMHVERGEIIAILGESGSGKSVLLQHLIGLFKPDRGSIEIEGVDITRLTEKALLKIRKGIGYLFQEGALYDFMSVYENIMFPLKEHTNLEFKEMDDKVRKVLTMVGLEGAHGKYPSQLSGGMKKRAALARSIILDSKILFCDEPTSGLDPIRSRDISMLIHQISKEFRCTTLVTSHDVRNSFRIADRLAIIRQGKIVAMGTRRELEKIQDSFVQDFLS